MPNRISYNKPYKSAKDLVQLLQTRGLIINNLNRAENYIRHIGYYRLSAYMFPHLEKPKRKHIFKGNTSFQNILNLYKFDKKLRLLLFNEIEKIEVAVRSSQKIFGKDSFFYKAIYSNCNVHERMLQFFCWVWREILHDGEIFTKDFLNL